jgi:hypothetical protein
VVEIVAACRRPIVRGSVVEIGMAGVRFFALRCGHAVIAAAPAATAATSAPPPAPARAAFAGCVVAARLAAWLIALARFARNGVSPGGPFAAVCSLRTRGPFSALGSFDTALGRPCGFTRGGQAEARIEAIPAGAAARRGRFRGIRAGWLPGLFGRPLGRRGRGVAIW